MHEVHIVPLTAEQAVTLLTEPERFVERFGLTPVEGYLAFPEALEPTIAALEGGVDPAWFSHLIVEGTEVVGLGGFTGPPTDGEVEIGYSAACCRGRAWRRPRSGCGSRARPPRACAAPSPHARGRERLDHHPAPPRLRPRRRGARPRRGHGVGRRCGTSAGDRRVITSDRARDRARVTPPPSSASWLWIAAVVVNLVGSLVSLVTTPPALALNSIVGLVVGVLFLAIVVFLALLAAPGRRRAADPARRRRTGSRSGDHRPRPGRRAPGWRVSLQRPAPPTVGFVQAALIVAAILLLVPGAGERVLR